MSTSFHTENAFSVKQSENMHTFSHGHIERDKKVIFDSKIILSTVFFMLSVYSGSYKEREGFVTCLL